MDSKDYNHPQKVPKMQEPILEQNAKTVKSALMKCEGVTGVYVYTTAKNLIRFALKIKYKKGKKWIPYRKLGFRTIEEAEEYRRKLEDMRYHERWFPEKLNMSLYRKNGHSRKLPLTPYVIRKAWKGLQGPKAGVYFIQPVAGGLIKVGYTDNIFTRFRQIQYHSPIPLQLLGMIEGDKVLEVGLHLEFLKERHHGEWFLPQGRIKEFLFDQGLKFIDPVFTYIKDWDHNIVEKLSAHFPQEGKHVEPEYSKSEELPRTG